MNNKLIFTYLTIILVIVLVIFKTRENSMEHHFENMEAKVKEATTLSTKIQDKSNGFTELERVALQEKVNILFKSIENDAQNMDNKGASYAKKLDEVNSKKFNVELNHFLELVLTQWQEVNLTLTSSEIKQIRANFKHKGRVGISAKVRDKINIGIVKTTPFTSLPKWFAEMENFFAQKHHTKNRYSALLMNQYDVLISLSLPFISFEEIIKLDSFDDSLVSRNSFMDLNIPRDLNETKRVYHAILELPEEYIVNYMYGIEKFNQAFKAQMLMVTLMHNPQKSMEVDAYLKEVIASAPSYLFDYSKRDGVMDIAYSDEPAREMVYGNHSFELNRLIYKRSSEVFQKLFNKYEAYKDKEDKFKKIVSTTLAEDNRSISQRVGREQMELAKLLESFDEVLKKHNIKLAPPLNDEQIEKLEKYMLPFKLPQEYITLYKWHNGMDESLFMYLPIEEALYEYNELNEIVKSYEDEWWTKNLFPLNAFNGDTYWFLDLNHSDSSAIQYIFLEGGELEKEYNSIEQMIKIYIQAFEEKIIFYNKDDGYLDRDEDKFQKLKNKNLLDVGE